MQLKIKIHPSEMSIVNQIASNPNQTGSINKKKIDNTIPLAIDTAKAKFAFKID